MKDGSLIKNESVVSSMSGSEDTRQQTFGKNFNIHIHRASRTIQYNHTLDQLKSVSNNVRGCTSSLYGAKSSMTDGLCM